MKKVLTKKDRVLPVMTVMKTQYNQYNCKLFSKVKYKYMYDIKISSRKCIARLL